MILLESNLIVVVMVKCEIGVDIGNALGILNLIHTNEFIGKSNVLRL